MKMTCSFARPADTTAYAAGDVVGGVLKFDGMTVSQNDAFITSHDLRIDVTSIPSGMTNFRLHLYRDRPASAYADNDAWDLPSGDRSNYMGFIDLGTPADLGSTVYVQTEQVNKHIVTPSGAPIYGYLVTNGAFTPSASTVKTINVHLLPVT